MFWSFQLMSCTKRNKKKNKKIKKVWNFIPIQLLYSEQFDQFVRRYNNDYHLYVTFYSVSFTRSYASSPSLTRPSTITFLRVRAVSPGGPVQLINDA